MNLSPSEIEALRIAVTNEEGRIWVFDPNDGPLCILGRPGEGPMDLGEDSLNRLVRFGLIRFDAGSSYLITKDGRAHLQRLR